MATFDAKTQQGFVKQEEVRVRVGKHRFIPI